MPGILLAVDGHPDPGAADEHAPLRLAVGHGLGHLGRVVGIIDGLGAVSSEVEHLVPAIDEPAFEGFLSSNPA